MIKLKRETYTRLFTYLIDKMAVLRFRWCLNYFPEDLIDHVQLEKYLFDGLQNEKEDIRKVGFNDMLQHLFALKGKKDE